MADSKALREKRNKLIADARDLVGAAVNAGTPLDGEAKEKLARLRADAEGLGELIRQAEELEAEERALKAAPATMAATAAAPSNADENFRAFCRTGEVREQSLTGSEGGYTVAPDTSFYGRVISALKFFGGVELAPVTVLTTATGAALPMATDDDTSNEGEIVTEVGSHASGTAVTLGQIQIGAFQFSSKIVKVSRALLQDASINWEQYLAQKFAMRLGRIRNRKFTVGVGTSEPYGFVTQATVGRSCASGSVTTCTADDLLRLKHSVDPAYRNQNSRWMMNDTSLLVVSLIKDGDGQYIWRQGLTEGAPDRILGSPVVINAHMADMGASAKPIAYGDFSYYYVRNVSGLEVLRLNELYAVNGQVGFVAFQRADGALADAGQHPIKVLQNAAS